MIVVQRRIPNFVARPFSVMKKCLNSPKMPIPPFFRAFAASREKVVWFWFIKVGKTIETKTTSENKVVFQTRRTCVYLLRPLKPNH